MDFPFKKEAVKKILEEYLINHKFLSLKVCAEIVLYHGLRINVSNINTDIINRLETLALIKWENDFAVL